MKTKSEIVETAFKTIVYRGVFDVVEGNKPINPNDKMCTIPKKMYEHIMKNAKGCCFVFSAGMIHLMHKEGMEANMICTKEGRGTRASVLYTGDDERLYVANPVQDIEMFTKSHIAPVTRSDYYLCHIANHSAMRIPVETFERIYGDIEVMPGFYVDEETTLKEAMGQRKKLEI